MLNQAPIPNLKFWSLELDWLLEFGYWGFRAVRGYGVPIEE